VNLERDGKTRLVGLHVTVGTTHLPKSPFSSTYFIIVTFLKDLRILRQKKGEGLFLHIDSWITKLDVYLTNVLVVQKSNLVICHEIAMDSFLSMNG